MRAWAGCTTLRIEQGQRPAGGLIPAEAGSALTRLVTERLAAWRVRQQRRDPGDELLRRVGEDAGDAVLNRLLQPAQP